VGANEYSTSETCPKNILLYKVDKKYKEAILGWLPSIAINSSAMQLSLQTLNILYKIKNKFSATFLSG